MPPLVSILVPCRNEQASIHQLLEAIYQQTYLLKNMEVVISDGLSEDATRTEIARFKENHPKLAIRIVDNTARTIPSAINTAIKASRGDTLIRLDAHSEPYPDYIERCVSALEAGLGDNVGGVWKIKPGGSSWIAKSIAFAATHPLGVGNAEYRIGSRASSVDTVPFGAFRRSLVDKIGLFDESLLSNEDYEFNARIRQMGGRIWLDPEIVSIYYARSSLPELFRQYWRYGYWKYKMLCRYPKTLRWRQILPPVFVASLMLFSLFAWWPLALWSLSVEVIIYVTILLLVGVLLSIIQRKLFLIIGLPLSILTMHIAWGGGFLWSMVLSILNIN